MSDDFDDPTGSSGDRIEGGIASLKGRLCLFTPNEYIPVEKDAAGNVIGGGVKTEHYGRKDAIATDVVVLAEGKTQKTESYSNVLFFQGHIIGTLKKKVDSGRRVLGVVTQGGEKIKGNFPWLIEPATDEQKKIARDYLASVPKDPEDPFAV